MALLTLLQGKTKVGLFTAGDAPSGEAPTAGILGAFEDVTDALGLDDAADPLLEIDVSVQEEHSLQTEIVSHEIESGSEITDHARNLPQVLTINGLITDTPSGLGALSVVGGLINEFASVPLSVRAFQKFEEIRNAKTILDVVTALKIYRNMMIASVRFPKDAIVGKSLQFSLFLKEVRFVSSATAGASSGTAIDGAQGTSELGDQSLTP